MMNPLETVAMAVLQGLSELFPISSLGHAILVPAVLGWEVDQNSAAFLPFLVVLHLGTAAALLVFFWREWLVILSAVAGRGPTETLPQNRRLFLLVVVATVPAGLIGFGLEKKLETLFAAPSLAALFLMVNGLILFVGERKRRKAGFRTTAELGMVEAVWIGLWQSLALLPGISRSGAALVGGLLAGLRHEDAARFSFLLATPIIGAAGLLEMPKLLRQGIGDNNLGLILLSGVVAGVVAYLSVAFLMRYFRRREVEALNPFAYYCWSVGAIALIMLGFIR